MRNLLVRLLIEGVDEDGLIGLERGDSARRKISDQVTYIEEPALNLFQSRGADNATHLDNIVHADFKSTRA